jgi:hypothetical protein
MDLLGARDELDRALARTRAAGSARCRLVTTGRLNVGEIDFARDESHWWSGDEDGRAANPAEAINVGGRCYWSIPEGWREIRMAGEERSPGIGFLTEVFDPLTDPSWSVHLLTPDLNPRGFAVVGEVMTRSVNISVLLDGDGRIARFEAQYAPLIDPDDGEAIAPGYCTTYELHDFGAGVSMPEPPVCEVLEISE